MSKYIYKHRRGTTTQWTDHATLIPHEGEIVIELDDVNSLHKLKIGDGIHSYAELAYLQAGDEIVSQVLAEAKPRVVTVELTQDWTSIDGKYSQALTLDNITAHSRLDLQPSADMLAEFKNLNLGFVAKNKRGVITVDSVGDMPLKSYTMQATIVETELVAECEEIVGAPVGTPTTKANWTQTDETKSDYIKNKPILGVLAEKDEVAMDDLASDIQMSIGNKVDKSELQDVVDDALVQAKTSGEFNGTDGVSATHSWNGTILTVTSASGSSSSDLKGEKGEKGDQGIQGNIGEKGADGYTPVKGVDYWTDTDKAEIKEYIDEAVGSAFVIYEDTIYPESVILPYTITFDEVPASVELEWNTYLADTINKTALTDSSGSVASFYYDADTIEAVWADTSLTLSGYASDPTFYINVTAVSGGGGTGKNGEDGVGIASVVQTTTSTADDGNNIITVTLTDGSTSTFTVQNGSKGSKGDKGDKGETGATGADGKSAYAYARDGGYTGTETEFMQKLAKDIPTITQEAGQSEFLVMSQKAVTDLVSEAIGTGGGGGASAEYETVDSVDKMTDTSKSYVLSTTGTIWTYGEVTTTVEPPNRFVPSTATLNQRLSGSSGSVSANTSSVGSFVTDFIAVSNFASISPFNVRLNFETAASADNKVVFFNSSKSRIDSTLVGKGDGTVGLHSNTTVSNGETIIDIKTTNTGTETTVTDVAYVQFQLFVKPIGTSLTSADVANLTITFDHEGSTKIENAWYDTGMTVSTGGSSYETVDSVDEMTDTSKQYVLSTTGTLWAYGEVSGDVNEQIFDASKVFTGHMSGVNITSSSNKMYLMSVDVSQIPEGVDAYLEINGFYRKLSSNQPQIEKIGFSALENPVVGSSQLITCVYAQSSADNGYFGDALTDTSTGCKLKLGYAEGAKLDAYDTIKTVLFEVVDTHDASTITVYLQYSGTVTKWYDTGIEPSSGGGGNYVDLLVKINQNTSDIAEVSSRVTTLETGSDTLTVPSFWEDAVETCISKIKALQVGRNCITFPFFSDNHQRNGYAGVLIAKVMKECNIPYCFFGGDSISSGYIADEATMIAQDKAFDEIMSYVPNGRMCRAVGNHDGYWAVSADEKYSYTDAQIYDLFLREESIAQNKHFGGEGTYYYVEDIASKVRFIVLDTNDGVVEDEQLAWLQNTALSFSESGWAVVFISHQPISNHYHAGISNAAAVRTIVSNHMNGTDANKADVVGWFSGHIHRDRIYTGVATNTSDDSQGDAMGFTQVTITSDHTGIAYDDATKHTVANDDKSHAIDFVTINKSTKTVNITRLGIGNDRSYLYSLEDYTPDKT